MKYFHTHKKLISLKLVYIPVREHFSFAKIIHPPDRWGISRSWLNSLIIDLKKYTQNTGTPCAGNNKRTKCSFVTQHNATGVSSWEGACNWHADSRNVHQSCCQTIECSYLYHKLPPKTLMMAPEGMAAVLSGLNQSCKKKMFAFFITCFVHNIAATVSYDRKELLDIRTAITHLRLDSFSKMSQMRGIYYRHQTQIPAILWKQRFLRKKIRVHCEDQATSG